MTRSSTPKGTFVLDAGVGLFKAGDPVTVARSFSSIEQECLGMTGTLLGWSIPHGYAVVEGADGKEHFFHPEALDRVG